MSEHRCPTCGANMEAFWHSISPGLTKVLIKAYVYVSAHGENVFNPHDINLSNYEYSNYQKLRFHGLIARYKQDGKVIKGKWLITSRGGDYLKGQLLVPAKVKTLRNKVIDHSPEMVSIGEVMRKEEYWQKDFNFDVTKPVQQTFI